MTAYDDRDDDLIDDEPRDFEPEQEEPATVQPFDPALIRVETKSLTVDLLATRMKEGEIDLAPAFQREAGIWELSHQCRLIESLLIRLPIPAFYFDATNEEKWSVIDGLQRLTVFDRFINRGSLSLSSLEFLSDMNGRSFSHADEATALPRKLQRRILETQVTVYLIQPGTPPEVKFNLFKRINTGGLPLTAQEIRHALNQGEAATMLQRLAKAPELKAVLGKLRDKRMSDRECVLRFLAFAQKPWTEYTSREFDSFLNDQMKRLNAISAEERGVLDARFVRAMSAAHRIFGKNAFRKPQEAGGARKPINKALLEAWSIGLDGLNDAEIDVVVERKDALLARFVHEMNEKDFDLSVSQGTGDIKKVRTRFGRVQQMLREVLA